MDFHEVRSNFIKAARHGLDTGFSWMGCRYSARELLLKELIPIAVEGLKQADVDQSDQEKYLSILRERVEDSKTGSNWIVDSFNTLIKSYPQGTVVSAIAQAIVKRQQNNLPVNKRPIISEEEIDDGPHRYGRVDQVMSKELYTVFEEDLIDLVPNIMKWNQVRHMLVENREGELVGLVTLGRLGKYYSERKDNESVMVKEVMIEQVFTVSPDTSTLEAIQVILQKHIGCLPVLNQDKKLVGVVTEKDLLPVAASYLKADKNQ